MSHDDSAKIKADRLQNGVGTSGDPFFYHFLNYSQLLRFIAHSFSRVGYPSVSFIMSHDKRVLRRAMNNSTGCSGAYSFLASFSWCEDLTVLRWVPIEGLYFGRARIATMNFNCILLGIQKS